MLKVCQIARGPIQRAAGVCWVAQGYSKPCAEYLDVIIVGLLLQIGLLRQC